MKKKITKNPILFSFKKKKEDASKTEAGEDPKHVFLFHLALLDEAEKKTEQDRGSRDNWPEPLIINPKCVPVPISIDESGHIRRRNGKWTIRYRHQNQTRRWLIFKGNFLL